MSIYEMIDYDTLQQRIGIQPGETWYCGNNQAPEVTMDEPGMTMDDPLTAYAGRNPKVSGGIVLSKDINVNGLLLNHRDLNNTLWVCTGVDGWWTLPPSEIADVPKPYWDGSLLTTGRYQSRTITITGTFIPPDPSLVWYNRDAILRSAAVVRGVGLLAMCGNENPDLNYEKSPDDPFYDPPKMTLVQTSDAPLVETINAKGVTQFSMSFRAVNPAKLSVEERSASLPIEDVVIGPDGQETYTRKRRYRAMSLAAGEGGGLTTEYDEVLEVTGTARQRTYSEVVSVNIDYPIEDEEFFTSGTFDESSYQSTTSAQTIVLNNKGNYFSFPTFVFGQIVSTPATTPVKLTVRNLTTSETMVIRKPVTAGSELVIDSSMRRVGVVNPQTSATSWQYDDRNYLTMTSQWITLAPGPNTLILSKPSTTTVASPRVFWRDAWIG